MASAVNGLYVGWRAEIEGASYGLYDLVPLENTATGVTLQREKINAKLKMMAQNAFESYLAVNSDHIIGVRDLSNTNLHIELFITPVSAELKSPNV